MKTLPKKSVQSVILGLALGLNLTIAVKGSAQTTANVQLHASLELAGTAGVVYIIEASTDLEATTWHCVDFVRLPNTPSPYIWTDVSAPISMRARYFYRARQFDPPTNMVFIPSGSFRMGSPDSEDGRNPGAEGDEGPQTNVRITHGFWMGKHEVTQGEAVALMGSNPSSFTGDENLPVDSVSYTFANQYCSSLTDQERNAGRIPVGCQYRLPTEAEWEYGCRAMTSDRRFSFGDDPGYANLANHAWFADNSGGTTHPVGQKAPNQWGLYDMHGNVSEWVQDTYGLYPGGTVTNPTGPIAPWKFMVRGGNWEGGGPFCRSAWRGVMSTNTTLTNNKNGFRIVLAPNP